MNKQVASSVHRERILYLDGWRGIAIITVLIGHFIPSLYLAGSLGVELFFVLSGRLMASILFEEKYPLKDFFVRRFSRIFPALAFYCLVVFSLAMAADVAGVSFKALPSLMDTLSALTFTINYKVALDSGAMLVHHIWSVSVEEHCYMILALLALLLSRNTVTVVRACLILALAAMVNGIALWLNDVGGIHEIYWRTDVRLASVFLSVAVYLTTRNLPEKAGLLCIVCVPAGIALILGPTPDPVKFTLGTALLALAVNCLDYAPAAVKRLLSARPIVMIGLWSYSIYLWQQPFSRLHGKVPTPLLLLGIAAVALGSFYLIETPARRFINQRWKSIVLRRAVTA
jgi:peptidoglycan/LPS O-acetylase OafA/YrhL